MISSLPEPLRSEVRVAFANSMATVWRAMLGFCAAGFLTLFLLREVPMQKVTDETYGLQKGEQEAGNAEAVELESGLSTPTPKDDDEKKRPDSLMEAPVSGEAV